MITRIIVFGVEEQNFAGKDGQVEGARLYYSMDDGKPKKDARGYSVVNSYLQGAEGRAMVKEGPGQYDGDFTVKVGGKDKVPTFKLNGVTHVGPIQIIVQPPKPGGQQPNA